MKVVFVGNVIGHKGDITDGGHIRKYYALSELKRVANVKTLFKKNGELNWSAVGVMFRKNTHVWVNYPYYPASRLFHLFVLLRSIVRPKIVVYIADFPTEFYVAIGRKLSFLKKFRINKTIEQILLWQARVIIVAWPRLLDYFTPKKDQKVIIMPPGIGEDEFFVPSCNNQKKDGKKIALYFGGMKRKGAILKIIELFSELEGWELQLIGAKEGEEIVEKGNVKYLGVVSHDKLPDILSKADVILIPLPKNDYLDRSMPIKIGYALKSCKPVIATKLRGISEYVSKVGLEENVIYVEEWNFDTLKDALQKAQSLNIDAEKTIERLRLMAWEFRFEKAVKIALGISQMTHNGIEWI